MNHGSHDKYAGSEVRPENPAVPVVLTHVVMTVASDGTMTVTVNGILHESDPFAPPWHREMVASILDGVAHQRRSPVRVEIREADGTVFTDIITPVLDDDRSPVPMQPAPADNPAPPASASALALSGEGFLPGEDVAVAVVVSRADTTTDGTARGTLGPDALAESPMGEVILLGRVSGTLIVGHPQ